MNARDHALLHTAALLHELAHLRTLAGAGAPAFPWPHGYAPEALPEEVRARVAQAHAFALGAEDLSTAPPSQDPQLRPILASLAGASSPLRLRPDALRVDDQAFPAQPLAATDFQAACRQRWDELCAAAADLRDLPPEDYPRRLRPLLEWQASRLPGPDGPADLDWFARAHTRAAFALACAGQPAPGQGGPPRLMLLGGELSGIQGFLYDIGTALAAKLLKGRSFYLHLLCDSIRLHVVQALGLDEGQTLMDSGGRFLLLVPEVGEERIVELRAEIEGRLWGAHRERIRFHLAAQPFDPAAEGFQAILQGWEARLAGERRRPFAAILPQIAQACFHDGVGLGGLVERCQLTGEEIAPGTAKYFGEGLEEGAEGIRLSPAAAMHVQLARLLKGAGVWTTFAGPPGFGSYPVAGLGSHHHFADLAPENPSPDPLPGHLRHRRLNPSDWAEARYGFAWYGGAVQPSREGALLGFDQLARSAEHDVHGRGEGVVRLGYLRMDVDDLGASLRRHVGSFCRYSAVSRDLDRFFKGHLESLRNAPAFRDHMVLVYAGGDDLFAVGRWDVLADFAARVRADFRGWYGGVGPGISGGMVLVGARFPVARAAVMAGEAEDAAKGHCHARGLKDSLCLLGDCLDWEGELPQVLRVRDRLLAFVQGDSLPGGRGVSRGLLHKLMRHRRDREDQRHSQHDGPESWRWTAAWDLVRMKEQIPRPEKGQPDPYSELRRFYDTELLAVYQQTTPQPGQLHPVQRNGLAARWAELLSRTHLATYVNQDIDNSFQDE